MRFSIRHTSIAVFLATLAACGGGGGGGGSSSISNSNSQTVSSQTNPTTLSQEPGAPQSSGDTANDGFNWFNFRRSQIGLPALGRNTLIDQAAQAHSNYQKLNNTITHVETQGNPGFTGANVQDRLTAAGYSFGTNGYAYGEVISQSSSTSGQSAAEDLITAIYHRFVIFEPMFKEAGAGAATTSSNSTFFTVDFASNGLDSGLGTGNFVVYPFDGQTNVPVDFFSDYESPDPVPNKNEVGYPISIHADIISTVSVTTFTVQPHGGANLSTQMLTQNTDPNNETGSSNAAIIPLSPLAHNTVYDVQFIGAVDGVPASKTWSFTTK